jgi:hypothetical protein
LPVSKVSFHPPREFEAEKVEAVFEQDKVARVEVTPVVLGRNVYSIICHVVVEMDDGPRRSSRVEVNPGNGEVRITRLTRRNKKPIAPPPQPEPLQPILQAVPQATPQEAAPPCLDMPGPPRRQIGGLL